MGVWFFTDNDRSGFWPIWPILGWGIGVAFQYFNAYHGNNMFSVEREYEDLKRKQSPR